MNGKTYVGSHRSENLDDDYLGSGVILKRAIAKYGRDCFAKTTIAVFDTANEMFECEREIVNAEFVARDDTYNLKIGGDGGWDFVNTGGLRGPGNSTEAMRLRKKELLDTDPEFREANANHCRRIGHLPKEMGVGIHAASPELRKERDAAANAKSQLPEARQKRIDTFARIGHQQGEKNSQFGTCWIKHVDLGETKRIAVCELVEWETMGWIKGRLMKR